MRIALLILGLGAAAIGAVPGAFGGDPVVTGVMRSNFQTLMELQPYVTDERAIHDPRNNDAIQERLDKLSGLKHVFTKSASDMEPGLAALSGMFSDYVRDVQEAFHSGYKGYVRNQIRTMTGLCMGCHSRLSTDASFVDATKKVESSDLSRFQKAEFFAATRQFDKAIKAFEDIVEKPSENDPGMIELGRAMRSLLAITVRVKQDPKASLRVIRTAQRRKDLPDFFKRYLDAWQKDVVEWIQERKLPKDAPAAERMRLASALFEKGQKKQLFPADHTSDVTYLRATNLIHEALLKNPKGPYRAEALYLLGNSYEALQDPLLWALDGLYFEACIREFPHTATSKKCYSRYASKIYLGYSGSGGTFVPEDEMKRLVELQNLAQ